MAVIKKMQGNPHKTRNGLTSQQTRDSYGMTPKAGQIKVKPAKLTNPKVSVPKGKNTYAQFNRSRKFN